MLASGVFSLSLGRPTQVRATNAAEICVVSIKLTSTVDNYEVCKQCSKKPWNTCFPKGAGGSQNWCWGASSKPAGLGA